MMDGDALAAAGRRMGAMYVWGYSAEMCLKAWYFEETAMAATHPVTPAHLKMAKQRAKILATKVFENLHDLVAWAELIRAEHSYLGRPLAPLFGNQLVATAQDVQLSWREFLRYHDNVASAREADAMRESVAWIVARSRRK
jgi:hypothetical protein